MLTAGMMASLGLVLVVAVMIGFVLGLLLDRWLGTTPWLCVVGLLLGAASGFVEMFRLAKRYIDTD
jgi:ATP synthase protein I